MLPLFTLLAQNASWTDLTGQNSNNNCIIDGVPTLKCLEIVFGNILFMTSALIILVLFVMFILGGFNYVTSFGNPEKVKKAQATLRYALLGLILYISSFLILRTIDFLFLGNEGKIFKFEIGPPTGPSGSGQGGGNCKQPGTNAQSALECCSGQIANNVCQ